MSAEERSVRSRLLEAGKKEFLDRGYRGASLRKICANAGVTTGALYFFFQGKEDLFAQLVGDVVEQLERMVGEMTEKELEDSSVGVDNEKQLLEFLWKNRDIVILLLEKSEGTRYEGYWKEALLRMEAEYRRFFEKYGNIAAADEDLIYILVKMKAQGYLELVTGGYSMEKTLALAEMVGWYAESGFVYLMDKINRKTEKDRM